MKKSLIWKIFLLGLILILIVSFVLRVIYLREFHKNLKPAAEEDRQKIIEVLSKSINVSDYHLEFGNIYSEDNKKIASVKLIKNGSGKRYLIDLKGEKIIKD